MIVFMVNNFVGEQLNLEQNKLSFESRYMVLDYFSFQLAIMGGGVCEYLFVINVRLKLFIRE